MMFQGQTLHLNVQPKQRTALVISTVLSDNVFTQENRKTRITWKSVIAQKAQIKIHTVLTFIHWSRESYYLMFSLRLCVVRDPDTWKSMKLQKVQVSTCFQVVIACNCDQDDGNKNCKHFCLPVLCLLIDQHILVTFSTHVASSLRHKWEYDL